MRKLLLFGSLSFGIAVSLAAGQHAAVSVAGPPVVSRAVPTGQVAAAHALPLHSPTHAHSGSNVGATVHSSTVSSHRSGNPPLPVHTIPPAPLGGSVNPITAGPSFCNGRGSGFVGLNACPPTTGVVLPFFGGSVYIPIPYYADAGAPPDQEAPQEEASNQPPDSNAQASDQDSSGGGPAPSRYRSSANDFTKSLSEFVFVERDGTKIYAVAYSFLNDKLQYVTKEGVRRTVALDSLDLDATQKQNEDLGNTINLPTPVASGVAFHLPVAPLR